MHFRGVGTTPNNKISHKNARSPQAFQEFASSAVNAHNYPALRFRQRPRRRALFAVVGPMYRIDRLDPESAAPVLQSPRDRIQLTIVEIADLTSCHTNREKHHQHLLCDI